MSTNLVRLRNAAIAFKIETIPGTDAIAGTPAAVDWLEGEVEISFEQNTIPNPVVTGSLDRAPAIVGGLKPSVRIKVPLRGSGAVATAPEWGKLLRCCTMAEIPTAAAIGAPTAATAGTATSATLATPFAATAQLYRGMPLALTGGPIAITGILDYSAGRVATLGETLAAAVTATTLAQIPANILYATTSDETVFKTGTVYFFADGLRWRFAGFVGTWSLELTTGGVGFLSFEGARDLPRLHGHRHARPAGTPSSARRRRALSRASASSTARPRASAASPSRPVSPPCCRTIRRRAEGYDAAVPTQRDVQGTMDPLSDTTVSVARFDAFRTGTNVPLMAMIGSVPGNRFLVTLPSIRKTAMNPQDREGMGVDAISFQGDGADAAVFLCAF